MRKIRLAFPGKFGRWALRFAWSAEGGLHPFHGAGKVVWVLDHMREEAAGLKREATKCPICAGQRRPAGAAGRWNLRGQAHGVNAPAGQSRVRVLQEPNTIACFQQIGSRERDPLSCIFLSWRLAIPGIRLRHKGRGIRESVLIERNFL
jgi:hypothetical protein